MNPNLRHIPLVILGLIFVLRAWYALDMRSILKWTRRKQQLFIEGAWTVLDDHFKHALRTPRPFVWFHRKYLMPGNLETQYALFLYSDGRLEESLSKADEAIQKIKGAPKIFRSFPSHSTFKTLRGAIGTRILVLGSLGRYDEARQAASELQKLNGPHPKAIAGLALVEYNCGRLDEALAIAEAVPVEDSQYDGMRGVASRVYCAKGDFENAIRVLDYEPADEAKFYSPSGLKIMNDSSEGAKLVALKRKKLAGIFPPARLILLTRVYVGMEDFEKANQLLDQAEKSMGPKPGLQIAFCRYKACCLAAEGKAKEAEEILERMIAIIREHPKRSFLWESHLSTGRVYMYLQRVDDALAEFIEAQQSVLHPIERHTTNYWIAKASESTGNQMEARRYYQEVAADPIPSKMRELAIAALAQSKPE